jgi:hypothetical protein
MKNIWTANKNQKEFLVTMDSKITLDPSEVIKQMSSDFAIELANKQQEISMLKVQIKSMQDKEKGQKVDKKE